MKFELSNENPTFDSLEISELDFSEVRFLLTSSIRFYIIISLFGGHKEISDFKEQMDKSPASISHSLKELESMGFITKSEKKYSLSSKGYLYSLNLIKLLKNCHVAFENKEFWLSHKLENLPIEFLENIYLICGSKCIVAEDSDLSKPTEFYLDIIRGSDVMYIILPIFSEIHLDAIFENVKRGSKLCLITTSEVLSSFREHGYMKELFDLSENRDITIWRCEDELNIFMTACPHFLSIGLFYLDDYFDNSSLLVSENPESFIWGKGLFKFYTKKSTKIIL